MVDALLQSPASGRNRRALQGFHAVKAGHVPNIYYTYEDALEQVKGYTNPIYQRFNTLTDAEAFMRSDVAVTPKSKSTRAKYYAVQSGFRPGVYTEWKDAERQVKGFPKAKHKSFATEIEAQDFVNAIHATTPAKRSATTSGASSVKGDLKSEVLASNPDARPDHRVGENATKKRKKNDGFAAITMINGDLEPGTRPLPPGAQDGFDRTGKLDPITGKYVHKSQTELDARKQQSTGGFNGLLNIYTDGASRGNGRAGAVAGIGVYFGPLDARNISEAIEGKQTNNRAELTAVQRALDIAPIDRDVCIYSDSHYAINCVTVWQDKWEKNGWRTSAGGKVENIDIIEPIVNRQKERELAGSKTMFKWVKGHAHDIGNNAADRLATQAAKEAQARQLSMDAQVTANDLATHAAGAAETDIEQAFSRSLAEDEILPHSTHSRALNVVGLDEENRKFAELAVDTFGADAFKDAPKTEPE